MFRILLALGLPLSLLFSAHAAVFNEIHYHPPEEEDHLQFIELFNPSDTPESLDGWALRKGVQFSFPPNTVLAPKGLVVIARNPAAFTRHFKPTYPVLGPFTGKLKHSGERLELVNAVGMLVESVAFTDKAPWPKAADGFGASLERIHPTAPAGSPWSWSSSRMPARKVSTGTPGRPNDAAAPALPPVITAVSNTLATVGTPTRIGCDIADRTAITKAFLRVTLHPAAVNQPATTNEIQLIKKSSTGATAHYEAEIPAQPEGTLVRWQVVAENQASARRTFPDVEDPAPTRTFFCGSNTNKAQVGFAFIRQLGNGEKRGPSLRFRPGSNPSQGEIARGNAVFLHAPASGGPVEVFDYVRVVPRQGGWKVHFRKDQLFQEMSGINLIFEGAPRWVLSEHLTYELFRKAASIAPKSDYLRLWMDGRPVGYHLLVEQPNRTLLRRNQRDDDANIYKILWYGQGLEGQHEKKTHLTTGHDDLRKVYGELQRTQGDAQWKVIQQYFNTQEFATYYAISQCVQNWDGYFNNHTLYHDLKPGGKWGIIPWDEDKTWGDFDGASAAYDWYDMPLTYGMKGDTAPGDLKSMFSRGPFGGSM